MKNLFAKKKFSGTGHVLGTGESSRSPAPERPAPGNALLDKLETKNKKPPPKTSLRDHLQGLDEERRNAPLQFCQEIPEAPSEAIPEETKDDQTEIQQELEVQISVLLSHEEEDCSKSVTILRRVLRNLVANPLEVKYQKLNLTNTKVKEAIVEVNGALEFLCSCGFVHEEEQLVYRGDNSMLVPKRALLLLNQHFPEKQIISPPAPQTVEDKVQEPVIPRDRKTQVLLLKPTDVQLPDWFFSRTSAEVKEQYFSTQKQREQDQTLMTRAQRERLRGSKPVYDFATIRIRLPEGILLQGEFSGVEDVISIHVWVSEQLRDIGRPFDLFLPSRQKLAMQGTVKSCSLMPATLLSFHWTDGHGMLVLEPTVRDEILTTAVIDWE